MKYKIIVSENFQTIETVVETEDSKYLVPLIQELRLVIKEATSDIEEKKTVKKDNSQPATPKPRLASASQKDFLRSLGVVVPEGLTKEEASKMLNELGY